MNRRTDRQIIDRRTERQKDRHIQKDRHTHIQTYRMIYTQADTADGQIHKKITINLTVKSQACPNSSLGKISFDER